MKPPRKTERAKHSPTTGFSGWDRLSLVLLLFSVGTIAWVSTLVGNPRSALNPFPPPTLAATVMIPSATPTPPLPTASATLAVTPTPLTPTATSTDVPPTFTPGPSPTATIYSLYPFILRGEPAAIAASAFGGHETCQLWVGGQVFDLQDAPLTGVSVRLSGFLNGKTINQLSLTGTALQYGRAGFEFLVTESVATSNEAVWVQLFDQSEIPLSPRVPLETYEDCNRNLILVNFHQVK